MSIKILLLDNDVKSRETLRLAIDLHCAGAEVVGEASTIEEAFAKIKESEPSLVFVDVACFASNSLSSFKLFAKSYAFEIVFTANHGKYAVEAFRMGAVDYLIKPFQINDIKESVYRARQRSFMDSDSIVEGKPNVAISKKRLALPVSNGYTFIESDEIIRCEADRNYTVLFLNSKEKMVVSKPLRVIEEMLKDVCFFRVNRSHLINLQYLKSYGRSKRGYVTLKNGETLSLSSNRKDIFLNVAMQL